VTAVNFVFINASNQIGGLESGVVASLTSATFAVVSGGVRLPGRGGRGRVAQSTLRDHRAQAPGSALSRFEGADARSGAVQLQGQAGTGPSLS